MPHLQVQDPHLKRYGLFGGTFNPVHQGHLELIDGVLNSGLVDRVLVVPARVSPFKSDGVLLPGDLRLAMLRAALAGRAGVSVSDLELRRPPPSYTVDTLAALESWLPRAVPSLLMGMDTFAGFAGWRAAGEILQRASLLVVARAGEPGEAGEDGAAEDGPTENGAALRAGLPEPWGERLRAEGGDRLLDETGRAVVTRLPLRVREASSSRIRAAGELGEVPPGARELLEPYLAAAAPDGWPPAP